MALAGTSLVTTAAAATEALVHRALTGTVTVKNHGDFLFGRSNDAGFLQHLARRGCYDVGIEFLDVTDNKE